MPGFLASLAENQFWWFNGFEPERKFLAFYVTSDRLLTPAETSEKIQGFPSIHTAELPPSPPLRGIFIIITFFSGRLFLHVSQIYDVQTHESFLQEGARKRQSATSLRPKGKHPLGAGPPHTARFALPNRKYLLPLFFPRNQLFLRHAHIHTHAQAEALRVVNSTSTLNIFTRRLSPYIFPPSLVARHHLHSLHTRNNSPSFSSVLLPRCCMRIYRRWRRKSKHSEEKYRINKERKKIEDEKRCRVINHIKGDLASLAFRLYPLPPSAENPRCRTTIEIRIDRATIIANHFPLHPGLLRQLNLFHKILPNCV